MPNGIENLFGVTKSIQDWLSEAKVQWTEKPDVNGDGSVDEKERSAYHRKLVAFVQANYETFSKQITKQVQSIKDKFRALELKDKQIQAVLFGDPKEESKKLLNEGRAHEIQAIKIDGVAKPEAVKRHYQIAKNYYQLALEIDPQNAGAHQAMAGTLYREGKPNAAREHVRQAIQHETELQGLLQLVKLISIHPNASIENPWKYIGTKLVEAKRYALAKPFFHEAAKTATEAGKHRLSIYYTDKELLADEKDPNFKAFKLPDSKENKTAGEVLLQLRAQGIPLAVIDGDNDRNISRQEIFRYVTKHIREDRVQKALVHSQLLPSDWMEEGPPQKIQPKYLKKLEEEGFDKRMAKYHGVFASRSKKPVTVEKHLRLAADYEPDNAARHRALGDFYWGRKDAHRAAESYQAAYRLDPDNKELARLYSEANYADSELKRPLAFQHYADAEKVVAKEFEQVGLLLDQGKVAEANRLLAKAEADFENLTGLGSKLLEQPADYLQKVQKWTALQHFYRAEIDRQQSHYSEAGVEKIKHEYQGAINNLDVLIDKNPKDTSLKLLRARAYRGRGDYHAAVLDYGNLLAQVSDPKQRQEIVFEYKLFHQELKTQLAETQALRQSAMDSALGVDDDVVTGLVEKEIEITKALRGAAGGGINHRDLYDPNPQIQRKQRADDWIAYGKALDGLTELKAIYDQAKGENAVVVQMQALAEAGYLEDIKNYSEVTPFVQLKTEGGKTQLQFSEAYLNLPYDQKLKLLEVIDAIAKVGQMKAALKLPETPTLHKEYYAWKIAQAEGRVEDAKVKMIDFKAHDNAEIAKNGSFLKNNPEIAVFYEECRDTQRKYALETINKLEMNSSQLMQQRLAKLGMSTYEKQDARLEGEFLRLLKYFIEQGKADTVEESLAFMQSEQKRLHAEYEKNPVIEKGWSLPVHHREPRFGDEMVAWRNANWAYYEAWEKDPNTPPPETVPSYHLKGGTLTSKWSDGGRVVRVVIGKEGGKIQDYSNTYNFPPSDQEIVVIFDSHGGGIKTPRGVEYTRGKGYGYMGHGDYHNPSLVTAYRQGHPWALDEYVGQYGQWTNIRIRDSDFQRLFQMESRVELEKQAKPELRRQYLLDLAKDLRHRHGSYDIAGDALLELLQEPLKKAIATIPDSEKKAMWDDLQKERPKVREEVQKELAKFKKEKPYTYLTRFEKGKGEPTEEELEAMVTESLKGRFAAKLMKKALPIIDGWNDRHGSEKNPMSDDPIAREAWGIYEDMKDPLDRTWNLSDDSWDSIVDEVIITVVTLPVTMGIGTAVRAGIGGTSLIRGLATRGGIRWLAAETIVFTGGAAAESVAMGAFHGNLSWDTFKINMLMTSAFHLGGKGWGAFANRAGIGERAMALAVREGRSVVGLKALNFGGMVTTQTGVAVAFDYAHEFAGGPNSGLNFRDRVLSHGGRQVMLHYGTNAFRKATGGVVHEGEQRATVARRIAGEEYRRLLKKGYTEDRAYKEALAYAQKKVPTVWAGPKAGEVEAQHKVRAATPDIIELVQKMGIDPLSPDGKLLIQALRISAAHGDQVADVSKRMAGEKPANLDEFVSKVLKFDPETPTGKRAKAIFAEVLSAQKGNEALTKHYPELVKMTQDVEAAAAELLKQRGVGTQDKSYPGLKKALVAAALRSGRTPADIQKIPADAEKLHPMVDAVFGEGYAKTPEGARLVTELLIWGVANSKNSKEFGVQMAELAAQIPTLQEGTRQTVDKILGPEGSTPAHQTPQGKQVMALIFRVAVSRSTSGVEVSRFIGDVAKLAPEAFAEIQKAETALFGPASGDVAGRGAWRAHLLSRALGNKPEDLLASLKDFNQKVVPELTTPLQQSADAILGPQGSLAGSKTPQGVQLMQHLTLHAINSTTAFSEMPNFLSSFTKSAPKMGRVLEGFSKDLLSPIFNPAEASQLKVQIFLKVLYSSDSPQQALSKLENISRQKGELWKLLEKGVDEALGTKNGAAIKTVDGKKLAEAWLTKALGSSLDLNDLPKRLKESIQETLGGSTAKKVRIVTEGEVNDALGVMGLSREALTPAALKKRYRELSRQYHPDLHPDKPKTEMDAKFKAMQAAFETLEIHLQAPGKKPAKPGVAPKPTQPKVRGQLPAHVPEAVTVPGAQVEEPGFDAAARSGGAQRVQPRIEVTPSQENTRKLGKSDQVTRTKELGRGRPEEMDLDAMVASGAAQRELPLISQDPMSYSDKALKRYSYEDGGHSLGWTTARTDLENFANLPGHPLGKVAQDAKLAMIRSYELRKEIAGLESQPVPPPRYLEARRELIEQLQKLAAWEATQQERDHSLGFAKGVVRSVEGQYLMLRESIEFPTIQRGAVTDPGTTFTHPVTATIIGGAPNAMSGVRDRIVEVDTTVHPGSYELAAAHLRNPWEITAGEMTISVREYQDIPVVADSVAQTALADYPYAQRRGIRRAAVASVKEILEKTELPPGVDLDQPQLWARFGTVADEVFGKYPPGQQMSSEQIDAAVAEVVAKTLEGTPLQTNSELVNKSVEKFLGEAHPAKLQESFQGTWSHDPLTGQAVVTFRVPGHPELELRVKVVVQDKFEYKGVKAAEVGPNDMLYVAGDAAKILRFGEKFSQLVPLENGNSLHLRMDDRTNALAVAHLGKGVSVQIMTREGKVIEVKPTPSGTKPNFLEIPKGATLLVNGQPVGLMSREELQARHDVAVERDTLAAIKKEISGLEAEAAKEKDATKLAELQKRIDEKKGILAAGEAEFRKSLAEKQRTLDGTPYAEAMPVLTKGLSDAVFDGKVVIQGKTVELFDSAGNPIPEARIALRDRMVKDLEAQGIRISTDNPKSVDSILDLAFTAHAHGVLGQPGGLTRAQFNRLVGELYLFQHPRLRIGATELTHVPMVVEGTLNHYEGIMAAKGKKVSPAEAKLVFLEALLHDAGKWDPNVRTQTGYTILKASRFNKTGKDIEVKPNQSLNEALKEQEIDPQQVPLPFDGMAAIMVHHDAATVRNEIKAWTEMGLVTPLEGQRMWEAIQFHGFVSSWIVNNSLGGIGIKSNVFNAKLHPELQGFFAAYQRISNDLAGRVSPSFADLMATDPKFREDVLTMRKAFDKLPPMVQALMLGDHQGQIDIAKYMTILSGVPFNSKASVYDLLLAKSMTFSVAGVLKTHAFEQLILAPTHGEASKAGFEAAERWLTNLDPNTPGLAKAVQEGLPLKGNEALKAEYEKFMQANPNGSLHDWLKTIPVKLDGKNNPLFTQLQGIIDKAFYQFYALNPQGNPLAWEKPMSNPELAREITFFADSNTPFAPAAKAAKEGELSTLEYLAAQKQVSEQMVKEHQGAFEEVGKFIETLKRDPSLALSEQHAPHGRMKDAADVAPKLMRRGWKDVGALTDTAAYRIVVKSYEDALPILEAFQKKYGIRDIQEGDGTTAVTVSRVEITPDGEQILVLNTLPDRDTLQRLIEGHPQRGYRALHFVVEVGAGKKPVEIQIQTEPLYEWGQIQHEFYKNRDKLGAADRDRVETYFKAVADYLAQREQGAPGVLPERPELLKPTPEAQDSLNKMDALVKKFGPPPKLAAFIKESRTPQEYYDNVIIAQDTTILEANIHKIGEEKLEGVLAAGGERANLSILLSLAENNPKLLDYLIHADEQQISLLTNHKTHFVALLNPATSPAKDRYLNILLSPNPSQHLDEVSKIQDPMMRRILLAELYLKEFSLKEHSAEGLALLNLFGVDPTKHDHSPWTTTDLMDRVDLYFEIGERKMKIAADLKKTFPKAKPEEIDAYVADLWKTLTTQDVQDTKLPYTPHGWRHSFTVMDDSAKIFKDAGPVRDELVAKLRPKYGDQAEAVALELVKFIGIFHDTGYGCLCAHESKGLHAERSGKLLKEQFTVHMEKVFGIKASDPLFDEVFLAIERHGADKPGKAEYMSASEKENPFLFVIRLADNMDLTNRRMRQIQLNGPVMTAVKEMYERGEQADFKAMDKGRQKQEIEKIKQAHLKKIDQAVKDGQMGREEAKRSKGLINELNETTYPHFAGTEQVIGYRITADPTTGQLTVEIDLDGKVAGQKVAEAGFLVDHPLYQVLRTYIAAQSLTHGKDAQGRPLPLILKYRETFYYMTPDGITVAAQPDNVIPFDPKKKAQAPTQPPPAAVPQNLDAAAMGGRGTAAKISPSPGMTAPADPLGSVRGRKELVVDGKPVSAEDYHAAVKTSLGGQTLAGGLLIFSTEKLPESQAPQKVLINIQWKVVKVAGGDVHLEAADGRKLMVENKDANHAFKVGDVVRYIPPVAGGSGTKSRMEIPPDEVLLGTIPVTTVAMAAHEPAMITGATTALLMANGYYDMIPTDFSKQGSYTIDSREKGLAGDHWAIEMSYVQRPGGDLLTKILPKSGTIEIWDGRAYQPVPAGGRVLTEGDRLRLGGVEWDFGAPHPANEFRHEYFRKRSDLDAYIQFYSTPDQMKRFEALRDDPAKWGLWSQEAWDFISGFQKLQQRFEAYTKKLEQNHGKMSGDVNFRKAMDAEWNAILKDWEGLKKKSPIDHIDKAFLEAKQEVNHDMRPVTGALTQLTIYGHQVPEGVFGGLQFEVVYPTAETLGNRYIQSFFTTRHVTDWVGVEVTVGNWEAARRVLKTPGFEGAGPLKISRDGLTASSEVLVRGGRLNHKVKITFQLRPVAANEEFDAAAMGGRGTVAKPIGAPAVTAARIPHEGSVRRIEFARALVEQFKKEGKPDTLIAAANAYLAAAEKGQENAGLMWFMKDYSYLGETPKGERQGILTFSAGEPPAENAEVWKIKSIKGSQVILEKGSRFNAATGKWEDISENLTLQANLSGKNQLYKVGDEVHFLPLQKPQEDPKADYFYQAKGHMNGKSVGGLVVYSFEKAENSKLPKGKKPFSQINWTVKGVNRDQLTLTDSDGRILEVAASKGGKSVHPFKAGDQVHFIPQVAGGSDDAPALRPAAGQKRITVGRDPDHVDFLVTETFASRIHATVASVKGQWQILDHSSYGVYINGHRVVNSATLKDGDLVTTKNDAGEDVALFRFLDPAVATQVPQLPVAPAPNRLPDVQYSAVEIPLGGDKTWLSKTQAHDHIAAVSYKGNGKYEHNEDRHLTYVSADGQTRIAVAIDGVGGHGGGEGAAERARSVMEASLMKSGGDVELAIREADRMVNQDNDQAGVGNKRAAAVIVAMKTTLNQDGSSTVTTYSVGDGEVVGYDSLDNRNMLVVDPVLYRTARPAVTGFFEEAADTQGIRVPGMTMVARANPRSNVIDAAVGLGRPIEIDVVKERVFEGKKLFLVGTDGFWEQMKDNKEPYEMAAESGARTDVEVRDMLLQEVKIRQQLYKKVRATHEPLLLTSDEYIGAYWEVTGQRPPKWWLEHWKTNYEGRVVGRNGIIGLPSQMGADGNFNSWKYPKAEGRFKDDNVTLMVVKTSEPSEAQLDAAARAAADRLDAFRPIGDTTVTSQFTVVPRVPTMTVDEALLVPGNIDISPFMSGKAPIAFYAGSPAARVERVDRPTVTVQDVTNNGTPELYFIGYPSSSADKPLMILPQREISYMNFQTGVCNNKRPQDGAFPLYEGDQIQLGLGEFTAVRDAEGRLVLVPDAMTGEVKVDVAVPGAAAAKPAAKPGLPWPGFEGIKNQDQRIVWENLANKREEILVKIRENADAVGIPADQLEATLYRILERGEPLDSMTQQHGLREAVEEYMVAATDYASMSFPDQMGAAKYRNPITGEPFIDGRTKQISWEAKYRYAILLHRGKAGLPLFGEPTVREKELLVNLVNRALGDATVKDYDTAKQVLRREMAGLSAKFQSTWKASSPSLRALMVDVFFEKRHIQEFDSAKNAFALVSFIGRAGFHRELVVGIDASKASLPATVALGDVAAASPGGMEIYNILHLHPVRYLDPKNQVMGLQATVRLDAGKVAKTTLEVLFSDVDLVGMTKQTQYFHKLNSASFPFYDRSKRECKFWLQQERGISEMTVRLHPDGSLESLNIRFGIYESAGLSKGHEKSVEFLKQYVKDNPDFFGKAKLNIEQVPPPEIEKDLPFK